MKIENGEFYLYKSFSSEFNYRRTLGYSFSFSRIVYDWPLCKVPPSKTSDSTIASKKSLDTTDMLIEETSENSHQVIVLS